MKILIVSGFLGAGKTTFIETLVQKRKRDYVVLENEYGEVGVDGDLLKNDGMNIWELTEGCVCCSMKANFATSILTIANSLDPEILIVEPTGVGMLSAVLQNIEKIKYDRIQILEPLTVVDPLCVDTCLKEYPEVFEDQIRNSKKILISKQESEDAVRKVMKINPDAQIVDLDDEVFWDGLLEHVWNKDVTTIDAKAVELQNVGFENVSFDSLDKFLGYMGVVMNGRFGSVIRAKGFLPINGVWSRFDIVDKTYSLKEIDPMEESKLILIGKNLAKDELKILFK